MTGPWRAARWPLVLVTVFAVAVAARGALLLRSGVQGVGAYDDGVHFAVAVDLVHGVVPYRDALFLQPPGIALAVAPFAALAGLLGDPTAFGLAKAAFIVAGGVNAVLTAAVLRRSGPAAALTGGLAYALAFPLVYTERSIALETLGTTGLLVAMLLLAGRDGASAARSGRLALLAGAAAGAAIGFKVWYVVAFAVLLAAARGGRARFLLGGALAGGLVYLPFFVLDPGAMWSQIVSAQLGRPLSEQTPFLRLTSVLGVSGLSGTTSVPGVDGGAVTWILLILALLGCAAATTRPQGRTAVALVLAGTSVLLLSPSFFLHYGVLVAAPLALVVGAATGAVLHRVRRRTVGAAFAVVVIAAVVGLNLQQDGGTVRLRTPPAGLAQAAQRVEGCVRSDDPGLLAVLGTLTRDVARGCRTQADPSGISYTSARWTVDGVAVDRDRNPLFQRDIVRYLRSGAAHISVRPQALLLQPAAQAALTEGTPLFDAPGFVLYPSR